jgi:hypothetical protein
MALGAQAIFGLITTGMSTLISAMDKSANANTDFRGTFAFSKGDMAVVPNPFDGDEIGFGRQTYATNFIWVPSKFTIYRNDEPANTVTGDKITKFDSTAEALTWLRGRIFDGRVIPQAFVDGYWDSTHELFKFRVSNGLLAYGVNESTNDKEIFEDESGNEFFYTSLSNVYLYAVIIIGIMFFIKKKK